MGYFAQRERCQIGAVPRSSMARRGGSATCLTDKLKKKDIRVNFVVILHLVNSIRPRLTGSFNRMA